MEVPANAELQIKHTVSQGGTILVILNKRARQQERAHVPQSWI